MAYIHPFVMVLVLGATFGALASGWVRFKALHLGRTGVFAWKRHVLVGRLALAGMLAGWCLGFGVTLFVWSAPGVTGPHWSLALVMLGLACPGLVSGLLLDARKVAARGFKLAHGLCNMTLAALALVQMVTGLAALFDILP